MIKIKILENRNMKIIATGPERKNFRKGLRLDLKNENSREDRLMETDVMHWLSDSGYDTAFPEDFGALTSAPMVCDDREQPTRVWAFMSYAVTSIPQELAERGYAILEGAEVEAAANAS